MPSFRVYNAFIYISLTIQRHPSDLEHYRLGCLLRNLVDNNGKQSGVMTFTWFICFAVA